MLVTSRGTGTALDKQLQDENARLQLTGEDFVDSEEKPDEEKLSYEANSESAV